MIDTLINIASWTIWILGSLIYLLAPLFFQGFLLMPIGGLVYFFTMINFSDGLDRNTKLMIEQTKCVEIRKNNINQLFVLSVKIILIIILSFLYPIIIIRFLPSIFFMSPMIHLFSSSIQIVYMIDQGIWRSRNLQGPRSICLFYPVIVMYMYCVLYIIG